MTAVKKKADQQFKVSASGPDRGETQAAFFLWAPNPKRALELIKSYAPEFTVVEVKPIGKLVPGEDLDPPSRRTDTSAESRPADARVRVWLPK